MKSGKNFKDIYIALLFLSPVLILFVILNVYPIIFGLTISFQIRRPWDVTGKWIGLYNYQRIFSDPNFYASLVRGVVFSLGSVVIQVLGGLAIALIVNQPFKGKSLVRALVLVPYMIPTISTALIMRWVFNDLYGVANYILQSLGLIHEYVSFLGQPSTAMITIIIANSWQFGMFATLMFLARLSSINPALYELADVMGASTWRKFRDITLPSLRGVLLLVFLLRFIWMFNKFDIVWLLTEGGPLSTTTTLPVYTYIKAFMEYQMGAGAALCTIAFLILVAFSIVYFLVFKPEREVAV